MPVPGHPRFIKRIESFREKDIELEIYSFERDYLNSSDLKLSFYSLGYISHGKYIIRLKSLLIALIKLVRQIRPPIVIYAFGLDNAMLGLALSIFHKHKNNAVVYECADIRSIFTGSGIINRSARFLERVVIKHCKIIVTTSPGFINEYFIKLQKVQNDKLFLLENKIKEPIPNPQEKLKWVGENPITIGLFGLLRCETSLRILHNIANEHGELFKVYVRGRIFCQDISSINISNSQNFIFEGTYKNPQDLSIIYSNVDLLWAAYEINDSPEGINRKWAMRNQFYEACFYKVPLIVQKGTVAAEYVDRYNIGIAIDMQNEVETIKILGEIKPLDLLAWHKNLSALPKSIFTYKNEHKELADRIFEK